MHSSPIPSWRVLPTANIYWCINVARFSHPDWVPNSAAVIPARQRKHAGCMRSGAPARNLSPPRLLPWFRGDGSPCTDSTVTPPSLWQYEAAQCNFLGEHFRVFHAAQGLSQQDGMQPITVPRSNLSCSLGACTLVCADGACSRHLSACPDCEGLSRRLCLKRIVLSRAGVVCFDGTSSSVPVYVGASPSGHAACTNPAMQGTRVGRVRRAAASKRTCIC